MMKEEKIETPNYENILSYNNKHKFDNYDRAIIRELDNNARKPLSEISAKVKLSRDAVRNRIKKLIDSKVIYAFKPLYNPASMGFPIINYVVISLYNPSEKKEEEFLKFLKSIKNVVYISSLIGKWDYSIEIVEQSRTKYGKNRIAVENEIKRWSESATTYVDTDDESEYPEPLI